MSTLLEQASLVMIPSGYKEDVVYSQIPTSGAGDLSFTRASNGTRVNSAGLVEVVAWNLFGNSEDGTSGKWGNPFNIASVTLNSTTAPNGTNTGNLVVENSANTNHWFEASFTAIYGTPYTISVYFKSKERTQCALYGFTDNFVFSGQLVIFNLTTGTVVSQSGTQTNAIESVGNGWYRCSMTLTANASATAYFGYGLANGGNISYQGNGTDGLYMWGRQLNTGTLKPYFPTTDRLNVPRLTYQNGGGGCPSLLLEKQSTNLYSYSEDLTQWLTSGSPTVTGNDSTSPDGTTNADRVQFSASGNLVYNSGTGSAGTNTLTVYAKAKSGTAQKFRFFANGATTVSSDFTATDQWQRFEYSYTFSAVTAGLQGASTGASDVLFWGFQHEISSYPTSYIPTTSSSATRVADACFKTGISSLIGQTDGVIYWDIEVETLSATGNENILNLDAGSYGNTIYFIKGSTGVLSAEVYVTGVAQCSFSYSLPSVGRYKMALAYKSNDFAFYVNGVSRGTDSSGTVPATSRFQMGNGVFGPSDGKVNQAVLFKTRLSNSDLIALTTI